MTFAEPYRWCCSVCPAFGYAADVHQGCADVSDHTYRKHPLPPQRKDIR